MDFPPLRQRARGWSIRATGGIWGGLAAVVVLAGCAGSEQYRQGQQLVAAGQYDEAVTAFRQAAAQEPRNGQYLASLGEAESLAADQHIAKAQKLLNEHRASEALKELRIGLEQMPAHPQGILMAPLAERQVRQCEKSLEGAKAAASREDWAEAARLVEEARAVDQSHPDLAEVFQQAQLPQVLTQAGAEMEAKRFASATQLLDKAAGTSPAHKGLAEQRQRAVSLWVDGVLDECDKLALAEDWERAWIAAVQALSLGSSADRAQQACARAESLIRQKLGCTLIVVPIRPTTLAINDLQRLSACVTVLERTTQIKPAHVRVPQRPADLGRTIRQYEIAFSQITDPAKLSGLGWTTGPRDVFLFVELAGAEAGGAHNYRQNPVHRGGATGVQARLVLVEAATGRILWGGDGASAGGPLQAATVDQLTPALRTKVDELFMDRANDWLQRGQKSAGDEADRDHVRFLFDCPAEPDAKLVAMALDKLFNPRVSGPRFESCRQLVTQRLNLRPKDRPSAPVPAGPVLAQAREPAAVPVASPRPAGAPAGPTSTYPARSAVRSPRPEAQPARPEPSVVARPQAPRQSDAPAPPKTPSSSRRELKSVFRGSVSRDDDRFPKELETTDGVFVKVSDTDGDPTDADLEIRVGRDRVRRKDQRIGARINVRGQSGRIYQVVILAIRDDTETVMFDVVTLLDSSTP